MQITARHDLFAGQVDGVDCTTVPAPALAAELRAALRHHAVLVFPNQVLDDDQQIAFSTAFGALEQTKVGTLGSGSQVVILTNIGPDGEPVTQSHRQALNNRANMLWHTDSSFKPIPAEASLLSARVIPSTGGDTEFISARAVYAALPERLKTAIEGRVAIHDFAHSRSKIDPSLVTQAERDSLPPVRQAMVLDHGPELGKSLYLGAHAKAIEGMDAAASTALIEELMAFATQERFIYRHQWRPHDLLIWHNRTVLHRATPFDGAREKRLMVRTTVAGEAPTLSAAA